MNDGHRPSFKLRILWCKTRDLMPIGFQLIYRQLLTVAVKICYNIL